MTAESKKVGSPTDDIDLVVAAERILLFFRKYKWVFITSILTGIMVGVAAYRFLAPIYKSKMVAHSFFLTNQEDIEIIENWNDLLAREEYAELSRALNCPESTLHSLKKIEAEEIQKTFSGINPHGFVITVTVTDNAILGDLQKGISYGLENNDYLKQRLAIKKDNLRQLIDKTTVEIQKLDSTKQAVTNIIEGKGKSSSSLIVEGATINKQMIEMTEKLLAYKEELKFTSAIQVLQGFSTFNRPSGPKLIPWLIIGLLVFLVLGGILAFLLSINEKIRSRRQ